MSKSFVSYFKDVRTGALFATKNGVYIRIAEVPEGQKCREVSLPGFLVKDFADRKENISPQENIVPQEDDAPIVLGDIILEVGE